MRTRITLWTSASPRRSTGGFYRRLSAAEPAAYLPNLAMALKNLSVRFDEMDRHTEALSSTDEAVHIERECRRNGWTE
jgi:hypothetical protein